VVAPRKTPKIVARGPPRPPLRSGGPLGPPSLGRCAFRLQRAFTEKTRRGPHMYRAVHKPDYISLFFVGQDGGSKGGTQTIYKGDTNGSEKQAMHCSCCRRYPWRGSFFGQPVMTRVVLRRARWLQSSRARLGGRLRSASGPNVPTAF
jgi:hypothetical protein